MTEARISVVICTHNPRADFLQHVLDALNTQSLAKDQWELLLVDNASKAIVANVYDISWHPHSRHVREDELGLTPARLRGIVESSGELLVFVDDDNVLDKKYLENALNISNNFKQLGSFGAGVISAEFETEPSDEIRPFLRMLALRDEKAPIWSNQLNWNDSLPFGAGQCVLHCVAVEYAKVLESDKMRRSLDRNGKILMSCGDIDLGLFACKLGFGAGVFPELSIAHLISSDRVEHDYLVKLAEGHAMSHAILSDLWGYKNLIKENYIMGQLRHFKNTLELKGFAREVYRAERRGRKKADSWVAGHNI